MFSTPSIFLATCVVNVWLRRRRPGCIALRVKSAMNCLGAYLSGRLVDLVAWCMFTAVTNNTQLYDRLELASIWKSYTIALS
jgi:hypothetical protein